MDPSAHDDVIQAAYRRLALRYHPDRNKSVAAAEMMARINAAYEVLSDPRRRAEYDRRRPPPRNSAPPTPPGTVVRNRPSRRALRNLLRRALAKRRALISLLLWIVVFWLRPELILVAIGMSIAAAAFKFRLSTRNALLALMLFAGLLALTAAQIGGTVYAAGLLAVNAVSDPASRGFWPDPAYMDLSSHVFVEVGGQSRAFETTTDAGRAAAIAAIHADSGRLIVQSGAEFLVLVGLLIATVDFAVRLTGLTRGPDPDTGPDPLDRISRTVRAGLFVLVAGVAAAIIGAAPQEILDELLESGVNYTRGGGINSEAEFLFWPMLVLDKVEGLGYIAIALGVIALALGAPRRRLFAWFDQRASQPAGRRYDATVKKSGSALLTAGICLYWFDSYVLGQFLVPTLREIGFLATSEQFFPGDQSGYPQWLQSFTSALGNWPLLAILGFAFLAVGSKTLRRSFSQLFPGRRKRRRA